MNDRTPECEEGVKAWVKTRKASCALLGVVCVLVLGLYIWSAESGVFELSATGPAENYYNLLVQGFRDGQLGVKRDVPPELAQITVPYDPAVNASRRHLLQDMSWVQLHRLHDLSYYRGKLYLYFGVTPALLLFWPYAAVTGHYLPHKDAVVIFFSVGFLASAGLLWALWRRYFAEASVAVVAAGTLALGLANFIPAMLRCPQVYEAAISCGYALTMLTLVAIWGALHQPPRRGRWLMAASLAYGLAVGARPSLLLGAVVLLAPVIQAWREKQRVWTLLLAATGPIVLIGLGLMLYNYLRFDDPLEFGQRYQLPVSWHQQFSPAFLWVNFRVGFLELASWDNHFPFVHGITPPPLPSGYFEVDNAFGVLTNVPLVWLALAAPLAWRGRLAETHSSLRWFLAMVALLFGACALTLALHDSMCLRYEVEFASPLVLLAVAGILSLERALAGRPVWRRAVRWSWGLLLALSVAFNLFASIARQVETENVIGIVLRRGGRTDEAITHFRKALEIQPAFATALNNLGEALVQQGKMVEAMGHYEQALRVKPDLAEAHNNLGIALARQGRMPEAMGHYEQALRLKPDFAEAQNNLGALLFQQGKVSEAIAQHEQALRLKPDDAKARLSLGTALFRLGRVAEAVGQYEEALRLAPGEGKARNNLGVALYQLGEAAAAQGKWEEAIRQYERAVAMKPDNAPAYDSLGLALSRAGRFAEAVGNYQKALAIDSRLVSAQNNLAWLLATCADKSVRDGVRAVELAEQANRLAGGNDPGILDTLAAAYAEAGRFGEAVRVARAVIELAKAAGQAETARQIEARLKLYQAGRAYHEGSANTP